MASLARGNLVVGWRWASRGLFKDPGAMGPKLHHGRSGLRSARSADVSQAIRDRLGRGPLIFYRQHRLWPIGAYAAEFWPLGVS
jgi:hypothetical protein